MISTEFPHDLPLHSPQATIHFKPCFRHEHKFVRHFGFVRQYFDWFQHLTLREKCPCSELFWSVFSSIRNEYREYLSVFSPNAGKYGPE